LLAIDILYNKLFTDCKFFELRVFLNHSKRTAFDLKYKAQLFLKLLISESNVTISFVKFISLLFIFSVVGSIISFTSHGFLESAIFIIFN